MPDHIDQFLFHANTARERAAAAEGEFRRQWLQVAEMWELLAKEYRRIRDGDAEHQVARPITAPATSAPAIRTEYQLASMDDARTRTGGSGKRF